MSEWQPIETAPKGGFPADFHGQRLVIDPAWVDPPKILLKFSDGTVSVAYWDWYYAEGGNGFDPKHLAWIEPISGEQLTRYCSQPIAWMLLPIEVIP